MQSTITFDHAYLKMAAIAWQYLQLVADEPMTSTEIRAAALKACRDINPDFKCCYESYPEIEPTLLALISASQDASALDLQVLLSLLSVSENHSALDSKALLAQYVLALPEQPLEAIAYDDFLIKLLHNKT